VLPGREVTFVAVLSSMLLFAAARLSLGASALYPLNGPEAEDVTAQLKESATFLASDTPALEPAQPFVLKRSCPSRDVACIARMAAALRLDLVFLGSTRRAGGTALILSLSAVFPDGTKSSAARVRLDTMTQNLAPVRELLSVLAQQIPAPSSTQIASGHAESARPTETNPTLSAASPAPEPPPPPLAEAPVSGHPNETLHATIGAAAFSDVLGATVGGWIEAGVRWKWLEAHARLTAGAVWAPGVEVDAVFSVGPIEPALGVRGDWAPAVGAVEGGPTLGLRIPLGAGFRFLAEAGLSLASAPSNFKPIGLLVSGGVSYSFGG
jgi:hypothetical protein